MGTDVQAPQLLTVREVADRLKLSEKSVRRRIASGELPAVRLGGRGTQLRVDERELDEYVYGDTT
jgi:excisionase family DNA binding protein